MKAIGTIKTPAFLEEIAKIIGEQRDQATKAMVADGKYDEMPMDVNTLGIKREIMSQIILDREGVRYTSAPLVVWEKLEPGPDLILSDGRKMDVKSSRGQYDNLLVMKRGHDKKPCDLYFFIKFWDGYCEYNIIPYDKVATWPKKDFKYGDTFVGDFTSMKKYEAHLVQQVQ